MYNKMVNILRPTVTTDAYGSTTKDYTGSPTAVTVVESQVYGQQTLTPSVTFPATATAGSLLIVSIGTDKDPNITAFESGWSLVRSEGNTSVKLHIFSKESDGTETGFAFTQDESRRVAITYLELSNTSATPTISFSDGENDDGTGGTLGISYTAPVSFNGTVLAFAAVDTSNNVGTPSLDNGYSTLIYDQDIPSGPGPYAFVGTKVLALGGDASTTLTHDSGGDQLALVLVGVAHSLDYHIECVECAIQNTGNTEAYIMGGERGQQTYAVYFNTGIDVTGEDKIQLQGGELLDIVIPRDAAGRDRVTEVIGIYTLGVDT